MKKIILSTALICSGTLWAETGFNFGECSGSGTFAQHIDAYGTDKENAVTVGTIPKGIQGLEVNLTSEADVDIRLYADNGDKIVHWPSGILNKGSKETKAYKDVNVTYSGYNGVNGELGNEFIKVEGSTPSKLTMKAFGYREGDATVNYSWTGKDDCSTGSGKGHFTQDIPNKAIAVVGEIPADIENLEVSLKSDKDIDIQLYGADGTAIIAWPKGLLHGSRKDTITYNGMNIEWSGFSGVNGKAGHEYIKISGKTTEKITMKVYGYQAGKADVDYSWGERNTTNPCITKNELMNKISKNEDVTKVNTSCITDMSGLFMWVNPHFNQDIGGWDVSNVTNMSAMFAAADAGPMNSYVKPGNIGKWDVSNVTDMNNMFQGDVEFNEDISKWNVSNVTNMRNMFLFAHKFNQDISGWDISNVTKYKRFAEKSALKPEYNPFNKNIKPAVISVSSESGKEGTVIKHKVILSKKTSSTTYYSVGTKGITAKKSNSTTNTPTETGLAAYGGDYSSFLSNSDNKHPYGTFEVPAGVDSFEVYVKTLKDYVYNEGDETYDIYAEGVHGTGTIKDVYHGSLITPIASISSEEVVGGGYITHKVVFSKPTEVGRYYNYKIGSNNSATASIDFKKIPEFSEHDVKLKIKFDQYASVIFIPKGISTFDIKIKTFDISYSKDKFKTYTLSLSQKNGIKKSATGKIINNNSNNDTNACITKEILKKKIAAGEDVTKVNTSCITDMSQLFIFPKTFTTMPTASTFNQDISGWDVSNVTDMSWMFRDAKSFNQDISGWDVSNVTNMKGMFSKAKSFNQDISGWHVSKVTDMSSMFSDAYNFNQDIGDWKVSSVTNMSNMFCYAERFNQDISGWDVSHVTSMRSMFNLRYVTYNHPTFNQPIGNWDVSNVTDMAYMFNNARFNQPIGEWKVSNVTDMNAMFNDSKKFNQNISNWNVTKVSNYKKFRTGSVLIDSYAPSFK